MFRKIKTNNRVRWNALLLATSVLGGVSSQALAQEAPSAGLDEIIITAQKREQNLQDVPISVQAIGGEQLDQLNITDFADYAKFLPSLSYSATYGPGYNRPYMRGVASGENGNHSGSSPSVGTYLDEQPITTITGNLDLHLYDISRVEVLAGPQGTLYGASSQAGTVRIITNRPDSSGFSASLDGEVNSIANGGIGESVEGYVNIPLSNQAAVRLVGWAEHEAGFIDNVRGTRQYISSGILDDNFDVAEDDYNDVDTIGARAALRIDLNDSWTVTPQVMAQRQESNGVFAQDSSVGDLAVTHWFPEWNEDTWVQGALTVEGAISNLDVVFASAYLTRDVDSNQDYADYGFYYDNIGSGAYFTSDGVTPINPAQQVEGRDNYERSTYELRVSTPAENRLRAIGGLFFQHAEHNIHQRYIINGFFDAHEVPGWADTIWLTKQLRTDEESAAFGEVSFDFTEQLTGTVGLRLFHTENSLGGFFGFSSAFATFYGLTPPASGEQQCVGPATTPGAPCASLANSQSEDGELYRLNLQYRLNADRMIYATYSEGFRPGGSNRNTTLPPYAADFLKNYEFGWKTDWADGRVRWNGAVFFEQWESFQFAFLSPGGNGLTEIQNAGDAEIMGIESDIAWAVTDGLTLRAAATWLHGELVSASGTIPDTVAGTQLPVAPELKFDLTARYEFTLGDWEAFVQGAVVYQSSTTLDLRQAQSAFFGTVSDYWLTDISAGVERDNYRLSIYANNLFDERAVVTRYNEYPFATPIYDVVAQPLTIGVRLGRNF